MGKADRGSVDAATGDQLVDPQYKMLMAPAFQLTMTAETLQEIRTSQAGLARSEASPCIQPEIVYAPYEDASAPDVPLYCYYPSDVIDPEATILYLHGGGFVINSAVSKSVANAQLAKESRCNLVAVDYRLSPETPFPGPLEDCRTGLQWLLSKKTPGAFNPEKIILMGESAGGGLAAALALMARDQELVAPMAQVLVYPMLDYRTGTADSPYRNPTTGRLVWKPEHNRFGWQAFRGKYGLDDDRVGYFSPALAQDISRLPATFLAVGALDLFVDEDLDYVARLSRAGVPVESHVYPGVPHGFDALADTYISQRYRADLKAAFQRFLTPR